MTNFARFTAIALAGMMASTQLVAPQARAADACTDELAADGEKQFRKCRVCHKLEDGQNGVGPHLAGIVGRGIADVDGYNYSSAMSEFGADDAVVWDGAALDAYLAKPRDYVKGTKMAFGGIRKEEDRTALICYLDKAAGGGS